MLSKKFNSTFLFITLLGLTFCTNSNNEITKPETENISLTKTDEIQTNQSAEQISCNPIDCTNIQYEKYSDLDDKINDLMSKNSGRFLIKLQSFNHKLGDEKLESVVDYLREISKREGRVSIEPYYIGQREVGSVGFPSIKDSLLLGYDIYSRIKNSIKYRNTKNYNAKVLYHPKYETVMMFFFVHKNYGDVCSTIYSNCKEVEYLNDDTFDISLSTALKEAKNENVLVRFKQSGAVLPDATLDIDSLKKINNSTRLYKWFVAAKKTEKKTIKRDRFLGIEAIITVLDYSIKVYDYIQAYKLYEPAFKWKAEIVYSGKEYGGKIESVVFLPINSEEKK